MNTQILTNKAMPIFGPADLEFCKKHRVSHELLLTARSEVNANYLGFCAKHGHDPAEFARRLALRRARIQRSCF